MNRRSYKRIYFCSILLLFYLMLSFFISYRLTESIRSFVPEEDLKDKVVLFYREDCPDCQKVFPIIYARNMMFKDTVFVNMNEPLNRQLYIEKYQLKSIPTIMLNGNRYSGTNYRKIFRCINQRE
ncbi:thioredoxin domain-containing protein [Enterococcus hirae]|uniref:thioredoxin domain-containing protein n=1 Tax=Enterococcus hirae TaxID=1354 RepID=UPI001F6006BA|nr:thioredoxin family protein [Enterococcus hirae]